jgi:uncharacterized protein YndB with AHSA1/START domain
MSANQLDFTKRIDAAPAAVWKLVSDVAKITKWLPNATSGKLVEAKAPAKGAKRLITLKVGGRDLASEQQITEYEDGKRIGWIHLSDTLDGEPFTVVEESEMHFTLAPDGKGTIVTCVARWKNKGIKGKLGAPMIKKTINDTTLEALENLAKQAAKAA